MGHATRSVPILEVLINEGFEVEMASDGAALAYLSERFPSMKLHQLPGYDVQYASSTFWGNAWSIASKVSSATQREHKSIDKIVTGFQPDIIISDNRYGCYHTSAHNIFITHQLQVPLQNLILRKLSRSMIRQKLKKFDEVWIPDVDRADRVTRSMSSPLRENCKLIGMLSQLNSKPLPIIKNSLLILLSGPEPARTVLERRLLDFNLHNKYDVTLIRGFSDGQKIQSNNQINVIDVAHHEALETCISSSEIIICRSGYSTIMDLTCLNRSAIFIPTPGQPEQKELGAQMHEMKRGVCISQSDLTMKKVEEGIEEIRNLQIRSTQMPNSLVQEIRRLKG